jgi:hypothetical protein
MFVLSGRGLCDGPIPRPEESYRLWCVSECDQVKINNLDTCCEQVEGVRTAYKMHFTDTENENALFTIPQLDRCWNIGAYLCRHVVTRSVIEQSS